MAAAWFGNPIPQVVWRRDNVEIRESDGYSFLREEAPIAADLGRFEQREQPESGTAVLAFSGVTRRNRGRYELVLTNSVGTVTSECDVEVIGKCNLWCNSLLNIMFQRLLCVPPSTSDRFLCSL